MARAEVKIKLTDYAEIREALRQFALAESICRKIMTPESEYGQHYVDLDYGIIDIGISLTDDEMTYLRSLVDETDA